MILNGGKIVLKALSDLGVKDFFGYPGGAVIPLYKYLGKFGEEMLQQK